MNTLYDKVAAESLIARIENLTPETRALWGKMSVGQMLEHCSIGMETIRGIRVIKRVFIGYLFGKMAKPSFYNEKPFKQNLPTAKELTITNSVDFNRAKSTLIEHIHATQVGGPDKCTKAPHAFFGKMTPEEWGKGMYKHIDHHLQQFGV